MKDEVKEILDYLNIKGKKMIGIKQKELLLDYITNLQEEKEKYKRYADDTFLYTYEELQDKVLKLQKENRELNRMCEIYSKSLYNADLTKAEKRIDRAIEYLKGNEHTCNYVDIYNYALREEDLLNILEGDDKE